MWCVIVLCCLCVLCAGVVVNPGGGAIGGDVRTAGGNVCVDVVRVACCLFAETRLLVRTPLSASCPLSSLGTD